MATQILTGKDKHEWTERLNEDVGAKPMIFDKAPMANASLIVEASYGQAPGGRTLIIHLAKRPDVSEERATKIAQHALVDVFGEHAGKEAECDYRSVSKLREKFGSEMINESCDNLTVIFKPGLVANTRSPKWVSQQMAAAIARWELESLNW